MHAQVIDFIKRMRASSMGKAITAARRILEQGSYNINGSAKPLFSIEAEYVGVDWRAGPGVDVVCLMHKYREKPDGYFDFVLSTEVLEHDPKWAASLQRLTELLAPKGSMLITCAGPGRHAHEHDTAPQRGYYCNQTMGQLTVSLLSLARFNVMVLEDDAEACDLRLFAWRKK